MRKKLLVIEDETIDVLSIGRVLKQQFPNVSLEIVSTGEQALDWIQRFRSDEAQMICLVLTDLTIPRMSGLNLIAEFKAHKQLRNAPVVVFSSRDDPAAVKSAYDSGASGYVVKPETPAKMREVLNTTLNYWLGANRLPSPNA